MRATFSRAKVADLGLPAVVPARATGMELFGEPLQIQQTRTVTTRDKSGETGTDSNQPRRDGEGARSSVGTRRRNQTGSRASRSPMKHSGRALATRKGDFAAFSPDVMAVPKPQTFS